MSEDTTPQGDTEGVIDAVTEAVAVESAELDEFGAENADGSPIGLSHLMDVQVQVTVEVGRKRLTLSELSDLCAGSLIVLDRKSHEPADILVNGKVVARGEVVVVDGSYGVRVSHVVRGDESS